MIGSTVKLMGGLIRPEVRIQNSEYRSYPEKLLLFNEGRALRTNCFSSAGFTLVWLNLKLALS